MEWLDLQHRPAAPPLPPRRRKAGWVMPIAALVLAVSACSGDAVSSEDEDADDGVGEDEQVVATTTPPTTTTEPDVADAVEAAAEATADTAPAGAPYRAELAWGNFALSQRIADKLASGERLNFVFSLTETDPEGAATAFEQGWNDAAAELGERYGAQINPRIIGPRTSDELAQVGTVRALRSSNDIDCLVIDAASTPTYNEVIGELIEAGIPVFTAWGDAPDSKRFAHFGLDAYLTGLEFGSMVGQWAADGSILMRRGAVMSGDPTDQRSFDLMRGFVAGFSQIHSGLEWVNEPATTPALGFDPFVVYEQIDAWALQNSDVDIVFHTGAGLSELGKVIADQLLYGDMYAAGFHFDEEIADLIHDRLVVAAANLGHAEQGHRAGHACGSFLLGGQLETGVLPIAPATVTLDNLDEFIDSDG